MIRITLAVLFIGLACGQEHHHCEAPLHLKAGVFQYDHLTKLYRRGVMLYDGLGERVRYIEETSANQTRPSEDILILFREKKEYIVDLKTKKCTKTTPRHTFHRIGVQDGFEPIGEFMIGDRHDGVLMTSWYKREKSNDTMGITTVTFTRESCLPFEYTFEGTMRKENVHYHRRYYDIDPAELSHEAFAVPHECASSFDDFLP